MGQIKKDFKGACFFGPDFGIVQELSEKTAKMILLLMDTFLISPFLHLRYAMPHHTFRMTCNHRIVLL